MKINPFFIIFFLLLSISLSISCYADLPDINNVSLSFSCDPGDRNTSHVFDLSPNGYDGALGTSVTFNTSLSGLGDTCTFSGYNDAQNMIFVGSHIETQFSSVPSNGNCLSWLGKMNTHTDDSGQWFNHGANVRALYVNLGASAWYSRYGGDVAVYTGGGNPHTAISHFVYCNGGSNRTLWVNGTVVHDGAGNTQADVVDLYFGNRNDGIRGINAFMDEITIFYNTKLTTAHVISLRDGLFGGFGYSDGWVDSIPKLSGYVYNNANLINVSLNITWQIDPFNLLSINSTNFSMTLTASKECNCSAVVDREFNYSEAIKNNSEYKLLTTETTNHAITSLNDSFVEGNHYLCLSCVTILGLHNSSCDVKLNFSYVLPVAPIVPVNDTNVSGEDSLSYDYSALINIYIKFFLMFIWLVLLIMTFTIKGQNKKTIQFFNILQFCFGFVSGTMWWGISILIGLPVVFVSVGVLIGLLIYEK